MVDNDIETFYEHYIIGISRKWSVNLPFLCVKCGNCCTWGNFLTAGKISYDEPSEKEKLMEKLKPFIQEHNRLVKEDKAKAYMINTNVPS